MVSVQKKKEYLPQTSFYANVTWKYILVNQSMPSDIKNVVDTGELVQSFLLIRSNGFTGHILAIIHYTQEVWELNERFYRHSHHMEVQQLPGITKPSSSHDSPGHCSYLHTLNLQLFTDTGIS